MKFHPLAIQNAKLLELTFHKDERGLFARNFCSEELRQENIDFTCVQSSISVTNRAGTLRGLHFQRQPHMESKLIRCVRGKVYDVIVDLRQTSATYGKWCAFELCASEYKMLYVPKGCAHGFITLENDCELSYIMDEAYYPEAAAGILWNSPALNISWPIAAPAMAERDKAWPVFEMGKEFL